MKQNQNPIAKYSHRFNKAKVFVDRKKKAEKMACRKTKAPSKMKEPFLLPVLK